MKNILKKKVNDFPTSAFSVDNAGYRATIHFENGLVLDVPKDRIKIGNRFITVQETKDFNVLTSFPIANIHFISWVRGE